jgi:hypothetical protein
LLDLQDEQHDIEEIYEEKVEWKGDQYVTTEEENERNLIIEEDKDSSDSELSSYDDESKWETDDGKLEINNFKINDNNNPCLIGEAKDFEVNLFQ